jgi:hypothetical protein
MASEKKRPSPLTTAALVATVVYIVVLVVPSSLMLRTIVAGLVVLLAGANAIYQIRRDWVVSVQALLLVVFTVASIIIAYQ